MKGKSERVSLAEIPCNVSVVNGKNKLKGYDNQSVFRDPNCSPKLAKTVADREHHQMVSPCTPKTSRKSRETGNSSGTPSSRTPKGKQFQGKTEKCKHTKRLVK